MHVSIVTSIFMATLSARVWHAVSCLELPRSTVAVHLTRLLGASKDKPMVLVRLVDVLLNYGHSAP